MRLLAAKRSTNPFSYDKDALDTPVPAEPPHALRQHFAVNTRKVGVAPKESTVYSVAPMRFAHGGDPESASALEELPPNRAAKRAVLYLHPGGFVKSIQAPQWDFIGYLAEADLRVDAVLYPTLPEATLPDALTIVRDALAELIDDHGAENVTLIADSAGGALGLSTALSHPEIAPHRIIVNAPWLDFTLTNPLVAEYEKKDPLLRSEALRAVARDFVPNTEQDSVAMAADAALSALAQAGVQCDIYCGSKDLSLPDAQALAQRWEAATLHEYPGAIHLFHLTSTPEGRQAKAEQRAIAQDG